MNNEYWKLISDVIVSNQQWYNNIWSGLENISGWLEGLWYWLEDLSNNIESFAYELQDSIESIYGSNLPEWKSLVDIWRNFSFNGKKAIVALYAHGGISWYKMKDLFSSQLIEQLNNWVTTHDAKLFQRKIYWELNNLRELKNNIDHKKSEQKGLLEKETPWLDKNSIENNLNELEKKKIKVDQNINNLKGMLIPGNEIGLLDVWLVARNNDLNSLIEKNIINTDVLEVLVRNKHVSWNLSSQLSRVIEINENWVVKPLIELDGITGIFQQEKAQTLLQNVIVKQNEISNTHLWNIDKGLVNWFENTVDSIENNTEEVKKIDDTLKKWFIYTNQSLETIDKWIRGWFKNTEKAIDNNTEEVKKIDNTLKTGFVYTNQSLETIDEWIRGWFKNTEKAIDNNTEEVKKIDNTLKTGFIYTNQNLMNIWNFIQQTNEELWFVNKNLNIVNWNLENINYSFAETNEYLSDILSTNHEANDLLSTWNELQYMTNEYLDAINETILYTSEWLANILWWIWMAIVEWFEQTIEKMNQINITQQQQLITSQYVLNELGSQTIILQNIDNHLNDINKNLKRPMSIKANESLKQWINSVEIKELQLALNCFKKWLRQDPTHLGNNFWAGIVYNAQWKTSESIKSLNTALKKAIMENNPIAKTIYHELAKIEIRQMNLEKWKQLLGEAWAMDPKRLEASFAQADLLLMLWNKTEVDILSHGILEKIFSWDGNLEWCRKYKNVIKYLEPIFDKYTNDLFDRWNITQLSDNLDILNLLWYQDIIKKIIRYILVDAKAEDILHKNRIQIGKFIINDKARFENLLKEFWKNDRISGNFNTFFYIAYQAYGLVDQEIVDLIIDQWLSFDVDYCSIQNINDESMKLKHKEILISKIYTFWDNAKYMLRDYLKTNRIFNF